MNNINIRTFFFAGLILFSACNKTPEALINPPYAETSLDNNGGNWKTILLTNSSEINVPTPVAAGSDQYQSEISALKATMSTASDENKEAVQYWGANGVVRWHEIARELAANYNAAPNYNADGTYPVPDANNPTAYPRFPFANPPYASRAFALLAVAQYDALVTAWKAKFAHNRLAPYKNDISIQPLLPTNDLPSYPSEDAVVAAASREVLKFLFPGEKPYLDELSTEHKNTRLWGGMNVQSDVDAGDSLGVAVAKRIIAYAKTDRMGAANKQTDFPLLQADATSRGITSQWRSLEIPARPPLLPFFGNVKPWNFSDSTKVAIRPPAPPLPGSAEYEADLAEMRDLAKNRTTEQYRIAAYWADGTGTYTPPGHWNRKATEYIYEKQLNEIRSARVMALLTTAIQDAGIACWDTKYYYLGQRPTDVSASIKTATGIPNFPGYISGHSTFSGAAAEVLAFIFPDKAAEVRNMALEASESRIYGCIHFRVDCEVGLEFGKRIGGFAVNRGRNDGAQ
ncbi:MAG: hypothetical protein RIR11_903 [Bacteroidota bacterium]|jgi:hypothetical protein